MVPGKPLVRRRGRIARAPPRLCGRTTNRVDRAARRAPGRRISGASSDMQVLVLGGTGWGPDVPGKLKLTSPAASGSLIESLRWSWASSCDRACTHRRGLPCSCAGQTPSSCSPDWTRTNNPPVNSRMLCQLSYRGSCKHTLARGVLREKSRCRKGATRRDTQDVSPTSPRAAARASAAARRTAGSSGSMPSSNS